MNERALMEQIMFLQILCLWTLFIVLFLPKEQSCLYLKHNVSHTGFYLRLQVNPTQLGPIKRAFLFAILLCGYFVFCFVITCVKYFLHRAASPPDDGL
jgi:hypothetical protein